MCHHLDPFSHGFLCKYSANPLFLQKKTAAPRKIWYNVVHGTYRTPTDLHFRARAGTQGWHHALFPTDSGVDEAGLYRAQVGGELLAGTTRAACGTGSGPE